MNKYILSQEDTVQGVSSGDSFAAASAELTENHGIGTDNPPLITVSSSAGNLESLGAKPLYAEPSNDTSSLCDPSVTLVYMTALLENCPYGSVVEDTVLNTIFEILSGKEQAKENINKISVGNIFNQQSHNFNFNHRVEITLHVKTSTYRKWPRGLFGVTLERANGIFRMERDYFY